MSIKLYGKLYSTNATELNLSYNKITTICPEISKLTNLQTLDLSYNQITTICQKIGFLTNLQILDLISCTNKLEISIYNLLRCNINKFDIMYN